MGSLGDRMKTYEQAYKITIPERLPISIRLDGRNFHTITANADRPFDERVISIMDAAALAVTKEIQGVRFCYVQSDEINLFIYPWNKQESQGWFGNELQKMVSLSASLASVEATVSAVDWGFFYGNHRITFDSRAFVLPMHEVLNYFIWRQQDWERNSLNMLASAYYSHKQLMGMGSEDRHNMLHEKGINWNNLPAHLKRGTTIRLDSLGAYVIDKEMPILNSSTGRLWFWKSTGLPNNRHAFQDLYTE